MRIMQQGEEKGGVGVAEVGDETGDLRAERFPGHHKGVLKGGERRFTEHQY